MPLVLLKGYIKPVKVVGKQFVEIRRLHDNADVAKAEEDTMLRGEARMRILRKARTVMLLRRWEREQRQGY